jgi:hypothetical protein
MIKKKWLTFAFILADILVSSMTVPLRASFVVPMNSPKTEVDKFIVQQKLDFKMPPEGAPGQGRGGAGSRNPICDLELPLTALIPLRYFGLTTESPTFWFYVPYPSTIGYSVEFLLEDRDSAKKDNEPQEIYKQTFPLQATPGIINIRLPERIKLDSDKDYQWKFSVIVNPEDRNDDCFVYGGVRQIPSNFNLNLQLETATTRQERIAIYAENGLWYDTLTNLAELRLQNPDDAALKADWENLLEHPLVRLGDIVSEPLVPCCPSEE